MWPIAKTQKHDQMLCDLFENELIQPMRTENYSTELFTSNYKVNLRYFNHYGKGFYY